MSDECFGALSEQACFAPQPTPAQVLANLRPDNQIAQENDPGVSILSLL